YVAGPTYGDHQQPTEPGRGGRDGSSSGGSARGGGAIKLVAETLVLNGSILANGQTHTGSTSAGGGAGGSVWLAVGTLRSDISDSGIQANGGNANTSYSAS